jgi:dienelactone hydrolase
VVAVVHGVCRAEPLPGTRPLLRTGDLAAQMVDGIDRYLMRELDASAAARPRSPQPQSERLRKLLGVIDERVPVAALEFVGTTTQPSLVAEAETYRAYAVRWPVLRGVDAEGLLLEPRGAVRAQVVALPDADWTPEMIAGLADGVAKDSQYARLLAENGCRVLVPTLIDRKDTWSGNPRLGRMTNQPHREFLYRMAFQLGRHVIGYELQKVLAAVDWMSRQPGLPPVGVAGYGEGGLLAYFSAQLDPRIRVALVSGYYGPTNSLWSYPIYRNVWGLLREIDARGGGALPVGLVGSGHLIWEVSNQPTVSGPPPARPGRSGAAPGRMEAREQLPPGTSGRPANAEPELRSVEVFEAIDKAMGPVTLVRFIDELVRHGGASAGPLRHGEPVADRRKDFDPATRHKRQFDQLVAFTQQVMRDCEHVRATNFWAKLDTSSLERYKASCEPFRRQLWDEILGKLPAPTLPPNPHSRLVYDEPRWKGFEVTLDLYPDVFAYGILLVPKDLKTGERRPVVVCQHGLEGRPTDVVNPRERTRYYNSFGAQLADRGYIVYAPQNPYIGGDKFRVLQRKANTLGWSLFSFIIRQHERTLDWLATLPFVDADRMAFYGLSYGGKTAMRVPAVLPRYCLSICSGDFNEWTWKNASIDYANSYMFSGEYEMPEFNLGPTLVYAEMAALIAPRPFMVERGHDDGVGIDEWVAYEYAKVRRLYSRLGIPERTDIEFFAGGHAIHGQGTFAFLQKHLGWPR